MLSLLFRPAVFGIYFVFFTVGLVAALVLPTFSLFLAKEIGVRPLLVGAAFAGLAIASIAYNHWIGVWSDKLKDRRPLVLFFCLIGVLACVIFAYSRNYWLIVFAAVFLFSLSMVSFSQVMAYGLDYAEAHLPVERIRLFNAIMRAQLALAWVAGPPAGFLLAGYFGFEVSYLVAAALYLLIAAASYKLLPRLDWSQRVVQLNVNKPSYKSEHELQHEPQHELQHEHKSTEALIPQAESRLSSEAKQSLWLCAIAFSLMWGVNNAYLISLPIHLKDNLHIDAHWMGWVMATTAALEVPFMLLAGYYAAQFRLINLIRCAGIAALLLYVGIYFAQDLWQLFMLQLFNAIFIGVLAGLGVSVFHELMPGRSGSASALYTNTTHVGNLLSSVMVGVVADFFGYHQVFLVNIFVVVIAIWVFGKVKAPHRF